MNYNDDVPDNRVKEERMESRGNFIRNVVLTDRRSDFEKVIFSNKDFGDAYRESYYVYYTNTNKSKVKNPTAISSHRGCPSRSTLEALTEHVNKKDAKVIVCPDKMPGDFGTPPPEEPQVEEEEQAEAHSSRSRRSGMESMKRKRSHSLGFGEESSEDEDLPSAGGK